MTARLVCQPLDRRDVPALFTVTNLADNGPGSLRQAVLDANAAPGADSIAFAPAVTGKITLTTGELAVTGELTLTGPGKAALTVSGNNASRVVSVSNTTAVLEGLTISQGKALVLVTFPASGGGVSASNSNLTLRDCTVTGNFCEEFGGGVRATGSLTLERCHVVGNSIAAVNGGSTSPRGGGGVDAAGTVVVRDSVIQSNQVSGPGGTGGGLRVNGTVVIEGSTVRNNSTGGNKGEGGGLAQSDGNLTVRNSTFANNGATSSGSTGGGLWFSAANLVIHNSTVVQNTATNGGGISVFAASKFEVVSTIISGNSAFFGGTPDVSAFGNIPLTLQYSALGTAPTGVSVTNPVGNLPYGTNLKLGSLADNGGGTPTVALPADSPARNAGANPANLTTDQRGPGFARVSDGQPDIGAYELQVAPPPVVSKLEVNDGSPQRSRVTSLSVTFSQPVTITAPVSTAFELKRSGDGAAVQLQAAVDATSQVVTLTFVGGAVDGTSLADGSYTLTALATKITSAGGTLDGNNDGKSGDDYVSAAIVRRFGDGDGNGVVNFADFLMFRSSFGQANFDAAFDADGNGAVDFADFLAFRLRFAA